MHPNDILVLFYESFLRKGGEIPAFPFPNFSSFSALGFLSWYANRRRYLRVFNHFRRQFKIPIVQSRVGYVFWFGRAPGKKTTRTPIHDPASFDGRFSQDRSIGVITTGAGWHICFLLSLPIHEALFFILYRPSSKQVLC